ncbi:MAG TPA: hypothetical protein VH519_02375 [Hyphomicrobiaceae bacterium]|jgi:hypothetical protein
MTYEMLALLRALVARPSREIAPSIQPLLDELWRAGYVIEDAVSGWTATAAGCHVVESLRPREARMDWRS